MSERSGSGGALILIASGRRRKRPQEQLRATRPGQKRRSSPQPRNQSSASAILRTKFDLAAVRLDYLIVDGHSVIFAWPELLELHQRRTSLAREALAKKLRDYQDWTGVRAVVVFDGKGSKITQASEPGEIQIFYSRAGQSADSVIERLVSKYASQFRVTVATDDYLEEQTASAFGADCISTDGLRGLLAEVR